MSHSTSATVVDAIVSVVLVLFAGIFSGLTLSLFSIDVMQLKVMQRTGDVAEERRAARLLKLIESHHLVLVALLVCNAGCMTALPIFLEELLSPVAALVVSVTAVLFFGEVVPQATFVRNAIPVSGFFVPLIWFAVVITFVVSYPFGKLLDCIVGHKSYVLERAALGEFFKMQLGQAGHAGPSAGSPGLALSQAEVQLMQGAMRLSSHKVKDMAICKVPDVFMLSSTQPLDKEALQLILTKGFSRIPIFKDEDRRHILGVLLVKSLLPLAFKQPDPPPLCGEYPLRELVRASNEWAVEDLYEAFQESQGHMAVVYNNRGKTVGIVTLEDVFELLHSININDEFDFDRRENKIIEVYGAVRQNRSMADLTVVSGSPSLGPGGSDRRAIAAVTDSSITPDNREANGRTATTRASESRRSSAAAPRPSSEKDPLLP